MVVLLLLLVIIIIIDSLTQRLLVALLLISLTQPQQLAQPLPLVFLFILLFGMLFLATHIHQVHFIMLVMFPPFIHILCGLVTHHGLVHFLRSHVIELLEVGLLLGLLLLMLLLLIVRLLGLGLGQVLKVLCCLVMVMCLVMMSLMLVQLL